MLTLLMCIGLLLGGIPFAMGDDAGGIAIVDATLVIEGNGDIGSGTIWVNLTLEEVEGKGANASISSNIMDSEGNILSTATEALQLTANSTQQVTLSLLDVPPGQHLLNINVSGDAAALPASGYSTSMETPVSRLRPLDVGLGSQVQWLAEGIDSDLNDTGNSSIRDGDGGRITVPVINSGDIVWNGSIDLVITGPDGEAYNDSHALDLPPDNTYYLVTNISDLREGVYIVSAVLQGLSDSDSGDDSGNSSFVVEPPPLAEFRMVISMDITDSQLGDIVEASLTLNNSGEADWNGSVQCIAADGSTVILQLDLLVNISQEYQWNLTTEARPGEVTCTLGGPQRISENSDESVSFSFTMNAGNLLMAGGEDITISGGPWHAGDEVDASVLVHNDGHSEANASLWLMDDSLWSVGEEVHIPVGSSVELAASHLLDSSGDRNLSWKVVSGDSLISSSLNGVRGLNVATEQSFSLEITAVTWDAVDGIAMEWATQLSDGPGRDLEVSIGVMVQGQREERVIMELAIEPGRRALNSDLGLHDGQALVYIDADPIDWRLSGVDMITKTLPNLRPTVSVEIDPVSIPKRPVPDSQATISCLVTNEGAESKPGIMTLLGPDGEIFAEEEIGRLDGSSTIQFIIAQWPDDEDVPLTCRWSAGSVDTSSHTFLSDMDSSSNTESSEASTIPLAEIGGGIGIALIIALMIRLGGSWMGDAEQREIRKTKREEERAKRADEKEKNQILSSDEKREISCTNCDQGLKVPSSYSGKVACPSCKHQFVVEAVSMPTPVHEDSVEEDIDEELYDFEGDDEIEENTEVEEDEEVIVSSSSDILGCPSCSSKLRVPLEKRPATARCPACKAEFKAVAE